jgi:hypothetical protein
MFNRLFSTAVRIRSDKVTKHLQELRSKAEVPPLRGSKRLTKGIKSHTDFLKTIGRNTVQYADKFKDWQDFYLSSPEKLKLLGIKPP